MNLIQNERTKLSAATLNGIALAAIAAGFITPMVAITFGFPAMSTASFSVTAVSTAAWLTGGAALHWLARRILGGLVE